MLHSFGSHYDGWREIVRVLRRTMFENRTHRRLVNAHDLEADGGGQTDVVLALLRGLLKIIQQALDLFHGCRRSLVRKQVAEDQTAVIRFQVSPLMPRVFFIICERE